MVIRKEELQFREEEKKIMTQQVFLEKADMPTSRLGSGIPMGVLMLTNRRLFFFNISEGKSLRNMGMKTIVKEVSMGVVSEIPIVGNVADYAVDIAEYMIDRLKDRNLEFEPFLDKESSFVIPVQQIVSCEKYGSTWLQGLGVIYYKRRYLQLSIMHNTGLITNYCVYCANPKDPLNAQGQVNINKWHKEIRKVKNLR
jgi:hypothetical protein